jgi:hypothetical protein
MAQNKKAALRERPMIQDDILAWLLDGDVAIQHQAQRDLLNRGRPFVEGLQRRIESEGWGRRFLSERRDDGHWGRGYYQPKWTSTHYTLQDLRRLELPTRNRDARASIEMLLSETRGPDGGVYYSPLLIREGRPSDTCINGMVVDFASYFQVTGGRLREIVDLLLASRMRDMGWNCEAWRGATHSSFHTTICVLEGLSGFARAEPTYRPVEISEARTAGAELLLEHNFFKSSRTGKTIDPRMLMLSYPFRYKYDILRALDWFQHERLPYDHRMEDALDILRAKRRKDGRWPLQGRHPGATHFDMEEPGEPSRWNTLRALRVLRSYGGE